MAFPFFFILLSIKSRFTHDIAHRINYFWAWLVTWPVGVRITTRGISKLSQKKAYIYTPNHNSYLDIPVCNLGIPFQFRFMGKAELGKIPLFGYMFSRLHIAVKRENKFDAYKSFILAKEKLDQGRSVLLFPEGTIPDKKNVILGRFKEGAFRLAIENQVPLVPVILLGTQNALPDDGSLLLRPANVMLIIEDPIDTTGMTINDVPALKAKVYEFMERKLRRLKAYENNRKTNR